MDCALWLNRRKIYSADEIAGDPDIASLRGYFLAGSLVEWLRGHGGERYAKKLSKLSPDDPCLNEKLAKIFGGSAEGKRFGEDAHIETAHTGGAPNEASGVSPTGSMPGSFGGIVLGSYGSYSLGSGSFGGGRWVSLLGGSFRFGSYFFGSGMHEWEWEWLFGLYKSGSFSFGSFSSFHEWEWEWLFEMFRSGSFTGSFGSFWRFGYPSGFGSLCMPLTNDITMLDEYDRIMLETLMGCPLDRFGYGIHNI